MVSGVCRPQPRHRRLWLTADTQAGKGLRHSGRQSTSGRPRAKPARSLALPLGPIRPALPARRTAWIPAVAPPTPPEAAPARAHRASPPLSQGAPRPQAPSEAETATPESDPRAARRREAGPCPGHARWPARPHSLPSGPMAAGVARSGPSKERGSLARSGPRPRGSFPQLY